MSILDVIGGTPVVRLSNLNDKNDVEIWAKLEGSNPGGSIKDRPALYMIEHAEAEGALTKDKIILEPTSGNTGIGLAMVAAAKGYRIKLCMPECVSNERRSVLAALGAELELTPGDEKTDGAIRRARQIYAEQSDKYYMPDQFTNEANWKSHYETTAPEVWEQMDRDVDYFVAGMGTSGTLMGCSRWFKENNPHTHIVGVEPILGHAIQGLKNMDESIVPTIYDKSRLDMVITVEDQPAFDVTRQLATREGLFVGMSSGAAVCGALRLAERIEKGRICVILPDRGDRYLSTSLFKSICAECPP